MSRRRLALFALVLFHSGVASAEIPRAGPPSDPAAEDARKAEARAHFEQGLSLFGSGALDAALAEFLRSRELYPTRAAAQNAALALRRLHRFDEALAILEQIPKEFPRLSDADRQTLARETAEVQALVGTLEIRSPESGALVLVDGSERGTTPLPALRVSAGSHFVRVYKEGFLPYEGRVEVAGRQAVVVDAKLGALMQGGRLAVSEERGTKVRVLVDGVAVGTTPWEGTLPVGTHTVALRGDGDLGSPPSAVEVRLNQLTKLALIAEPLECELGVLPTPLGASVAVDSVDVGHGVWRGPLRCGGHAVEVAAPGFLPARRAVTLTKGKPATLNESLERDPTSPLWAAANPPRVTLDVRVSPVLGLSLGGDVAGGCADGCTRGLAIGVMGTLRAGYQLGSGLGFALDAGYFTVKQSVEGRPASVYPVGLKEHPGTANDELRLSGLVLGASASVQRGSRLAWMGRLGVGVLLGTFSDARGGTFTTPASVTYATPTFTETGAVRYLYVDPELRLGLRIGDHWIADLGLQALLLLGLSEATWSDENPLSAGRCPSADFNVCAGRGVYRPSRVLGSTLVLFTPHVGLRYEF